jgi:hypothetical protein
MPGRALPAAHPQTELTTTSVVPSCLIACSTWSAVTKSSNPFSVNSPFMGITISAGYISLNLNFRVQIYDT